MPVPQSMPLYHHEKALFSVAWLVVTIRTFLPVAVSAVSSVLVCVLTLVLVVRVRGTTPSGLLALAGGLSVLVALLTLQQNMYIDCI